MDVKDAIAKRRSVRSYCKKKVPAELIDELIDAARLAPSGNNIQPWRFMVVDAKGRKALKDNKIFVQAFVYEAPLLIICCADPTGYKQTAFDDSNDLRAVRDLSIATSFMVLRATELGLGSCYIGWLDKKRVKDVLDIPDCMIVPYAITFGYPDEKPHGIKRKEIDEILLK